MIDTILNIFEKPFSRSYQDNDTLSFVSVMMFGFACQEKAILETTIASASQYAEKLNKADCNEKLKDYYVYDFTTELHGAIYTCRSQQYYIYQIAKDLLDSKEYDLTDVQRKTLTDIKEMTFAAQKEYADLLDYIKRGEYNQIVESINKYSKRQLERIDVEIEFFRDIR